MNVITSTTFCKLASTLLTCVVDAECRRGRKTIRGLLHPVWDHCHFEELHDSRWNCYLVIFPALIGMAARRGNM